MPGRHPFAGQTWPGPRQKGLATMRLNRLQRAAEELKAFWNTGTGRGCQTEMLDVHSARLKRISTVGILTSEGEKSDFR